jgi:hypothetical protein
LGIFYFYDTNDQKNTIGLTYLYPQSFGGYFPHPYKDLKYPNMYLDFCLEDVEQDGIRNRTNAYNNCKKAIHIRVDLLLNQYGLLAKNNKCDFPTKLEIVRTVGLLPTLMLKQINDERNLIEHDYKIPDEQSVREAIDVAELLYMASDNLLSSTPIEVIVGFDIEPIHRMMRLEPEKGQLVFYSIEAENENFISLEEGFNIPYINVPYRQVDGSISSFLKLSDTPFEIIDLNYNNKENWEFIISNLCKISKNSIHDSAGEIHETDDGLIMSSIVYLPMNIKKDSLIEFMMKDIKNRLDNK